MPFQATWIALQNELTTSTDIPNWTADKGYLVDSFTIGSVDPNYISLDTPRAENIQTVPKSDFAVVYDLWADYCRGIVKRHEIRDVTRFSKYIISIFHWLETHLQSALP